MSIHPSLFGLGIVTASIVPGPLLPATPAPPPSAQAPIHANEAIAIRTLRQIAEAEKTFREAVDIDTNCDGGGEYGYFAELAGTQPMRVSVNCQPAPGSPADLLVPALLPHAFGHLPGPPNPQGFLVPYKGYYFQMWLAGPTVGGRVTAVREDVTGGKAAPPFPDPVNGARYWICYAWPIDRGTTGVRAFCINQRQFVLECANVGPAPMDGLFGVAEFDEALLGTGDLGSPLRVGIPGGALSTVWQPAH